MAATKKDLIDTKTKLDDVNSDVAHTNTKLDRMRTEMTNTMVDVTMKLDGKP
jgi:hypothetical protein